MRFSTKSIKSIKSTHRRKPFSVGTNVINPNFQHLILSLKYNFCSNLQENSTFSQRFANRNNETNKITLKIGDYTTASKKFSMEDINLYSKLTGDTNAVHSDKSIAKQYGFNNIIVHGMFTASLFATAVGANLPGSILVTKNLKWKIPVQIDETLNATVTIKKIIKDKKFVICDMIAKNENNQIAVCGDVTLLIRDLDV